MPQRCQTPEDFLCNRSASKIPKFCESLLVLFLLLLQGTTRGDDTIREILGRLKDLSGYSELFTFDMSTIYMPNVLMDNSDFCNCKELFAQEILKTLVLIKTTDQGMGQEPRAIVRMLQYNIKSLLTYSGAVEEHCPKDKAVVSLRTRQKAQHLIFIKQWIIFFQAWMSRCVSSHGY
ncbi:hypothetical protein SRHO_G00232430 [Serrasalmus rhombeus]